MSPHAGLDSFGHRLLHVTIDEIARDDPTRVFASLPYNDDDLSLGYEDITFAVFANAVNELAWFLNSTFGIAEHFPTIAYLGIPDIRYHILQMACAKTGYQALFSSHMNSSAGHLGLMEKTNTTLLLSANGVVIHDILAARPMQHAIIPELDHLLSCPTSKAFPYGKSFQEAQHDPYVILHSSGTTGLPKPIRYSHGAVAALDAHGSLPEVDSVTDRRRLISFLHPMAQRRIFVPFMHFHVICAVAIMVMTTFGKGIYVPGYRRRLVSKEDVVDILRASKSDDAFVSPAMLEDLAQHPQLEQLMSRLGSLFYGGAALNHATGVKVSKHVNLRSIWGASECGKAVDLESDPEDFNYVSFDTISSGLEFRQKSQGVCEMIVRKTPKSEPYLAFFRREDKDSWYVGDLWRPHPDPKKAPYTWQFAGRVDDLISYKDGNNFNPTHWELEHAGHPLIRTAILAGNGHRQPILLLELNEPTHDPIKQQEVIDRIWRESVLPINQDAPANGQVAKTHIQLSVPGKLFERTVKGTAARKATINKFELELERIYATHGDESMDVEARFERRRGHTRRVSVKEH